MAIARGIAGRSRRRTRPQSSDCKSAIDGAATGANGPHGRLPKADPDARRFSHPPQAPTVPAFVPSQVSPANSAPVLAHSRKGRPMNLARAARRTSARALFITIAAAAGLAGLG